MTAAASSLRARCCLAVMVGGYLALATIAGATGSPLTVLLPAGAHPPAWTATFAKAVGLDTPSRSALTGLAWVFVVVVLVAFALLIGEAWAHRVRLPAVLVGSMISLAIAVAAPLLLSRDVYTYAAYGRIDALYHRNPYVAPLASFPHDPYVAVASTQWLSSHSHYGPAFTLVSSEIARAWPRSPDATILAFKLLAGVAIALATVFVALTAARTRPERAPLAAALIGLNPVIVVHTVGGGHVDALIPALLAAGLLLATARPRGTSPSAIAVTLLLAIACLVKTVMLPVLVLWLFWVARADGHARQRPTQRLRILGSHVVVIAVLVVASAAPFFSAGHPLAPVASLGGVEAWASPSHLVGRGAQAGAAVHVAFLLLFGFAVWRLVRRTNRFDAATAANVLGITVLLLALSMPYLLPWYAAWFAAFLGLLADRALLFTGVFVTGVLALTLIPADPFHGYSSPAVMNGVHYGAASVLLVALVFALTRVLVKPAVKGRWRAIEGFEAPPRGITAGRASLGPDDRAGRR